MTDSKDEKDGGREVDYGFAAWLAEELEKRQWTATHLARLANIAQPNMSRLTTAYRAPSADIATRIAGGLGLPPETVFRAAGILPKIEEPDKFRQTVALVEDVAAHLSEEELDDLGNFALLLFRRRPRGVEEPVAPAIEEPADILEAAGIDRVLLRRFVLSADALLRRADEQRDGTAD